MIGADGKRKFALPSAQAARFQPAFTPKATIVKVHHHRGNSLQVAGIESRFAMFLLTTEPVRLYDSPSGSLETRAELRARSPLSAVRLAMTSATAVRLALTPTIGVPFATFTVNEAEARRTSARSVQAKCRIAGRRRYWRECCRAS